MKDQYQKELSQVHVPAELLAKTKLAMKEAEKKETEKKTEDEESVKAEKRKIFTFPKVSMVAVATVLLLIVVPVSSDLLRGNNQKEQEMQLHLSGPAEVEMQQIAPGEDADEKNWFEKLVDKIEELFE